jgi:hypothetical protein
MNILGIDLSLRSTGLCCGNEFKLIKIKDLDNEDLVIEISKQICYFINEHNPKQINLEGLSFDSVSRAKDIIAGTFWYLRCMLKQQFPDIPLNIFPVTGWRNKLFTKEERKLLKEDRQIFNKIKLSLKGLKGEERILAGIKNIKELELNSSIKYLTYLKLPINIKCIIDEIVQDDGKFDLCDAYFISRN